MSLLRWHIKHDCVLNYLLNLTCHVSFCFFLHLDDSPFQSLDLIEQLRQCLMSHLHFAHKLLVEAMVLDHLCESGPLNLLVQLLTMPVKVLTRPCIPQITMLLHKRLKFFQCFRLSYPLTHLFLTLLYLCFHASEQLLHLRPQSLLDFIHFHVPYIPSIGKPFAVSVVKPSLDLLGNQCTEHCAWLLARLIHASVADETACDSVHTYFI